MSYTVDGNNRKTVCNSMGTLGDNPVSYTHLHDYTKDFTVKAPVGVDIFITGFILTLIISLGTLLWQVRRAVRINPDVYKRQLYISRLYMRRREMALRKVNGAGNKDLFVQLTVELLIVQFKMCIRDRR